MTITLVTSSPDETLQLGRRLARGLTSGDVVLLHGDLGSGKTTLAQGIIAGLGVAAPVPSPTFTLVNEYEGEATDGTSRPIYHLDLYRLTGDNDLESIGLGDYLAPTIGISIIEWPERAAAWLGGEYLLIEITTAGMQQRRMRISAAHTEPHHFNWLGNFSYEECEPNSRY